MSRTPRWESGLTGWLAGVLGIVVLVCNFLRLSKDSAEILTNGSVSFLLIFFAGRVILGEVKDARKLKYVGVNGHWHRCHHLLRDLTSFLEAQRSMLHISGGADAPIDIDSVRARVQSVLAAVLSELASAYSLLSGTSCRTAIKAVYMETKLHVYALARDNNSMSVNYRQDLERFAKHQDPIEENDDFCDLYWRYGPLQRFFFCNDLTMRRNYKNTSFKVYGSPPQNVELKDRIWSYLGIKKIWPLPYRSTMVWPIQQRESPELSLKEIGCLGFLAVDSEACNAFNKSLDFPMGASVADALFQPLRIYGSIARHGVAGIGDKDE
ncbi:MAG: hypothetical protein P4L55_08435 [Syntrophobacteraceae bacterium]|nr:hypothetical protein [Syntrophobacteraceae bacterium]